MTADQLAYLLGTILFAGALILGGTVRTFLRRRETVGMVAEPAVVTGAMPTQTIH